MWEGAPARYSRLEKRTLFFRSRHGGRLRPRGAAPLPQRKGFTEINPLDLRIPPQLRRRTRPKDPAIIDNLSPVSDREGLPNIVVRNQNPNTRFLQTRDNPLQFEDLLGIDAGKRLVQQQELG